MALQALIPEFPWLRRLRQGVRLSWTTTMLSVFPMLVLGATAPWWTQQLQTARRQHGEAPWSTWALIVLLCAVVLATLVSCFVTCCRCSAAMSVEAKIDEEALVARRRVAMINWLFPARAREGCASLPGSECAICLEPQRAGESSRFLSCGHAFHQECIDQWWLSGAHGQMRCPMCRQPPVPTFWAAPRGYIPDAGLP